MTTDETDRWSVLDGLSFVTGAAVASVHLRGLASRFDEPDLVESSVAAAAFVFLSLTAAGPFIYLVRRFSTRPHGFPGPCDLCWLALGAPWTVFALIRSAYGTPGAETLARLHSKLAIGLAPASAYAALTVARRWRRLAAEGAPSLTRTGRISLGLAATWPLQIGLWMLLEE